MARRLSEQEIEELLGAFALDAVDGDERVQIERALQASPRLRAEVEGYREVAGMLAQGGTEAPAGVWDRISAQLAGPAPDLTIDLPGPDGNLTQLRPAPPTARPGPRGLPYLLAAAAVIIVALGAVVVNQFDRIDDLEADRQEQAALLEAANAAFADPAAREAPLGDADGNPVARAAVHADGSGYLLAQNLPALPDDRTYQLWGVDGDVVISLGVLGNQPQVVPFRAAPGVDALVLTDEVAGGVPTSDQPALYQGELET